MPYRPTERLTGHNVLNPHPRAHALNRHPRARPVDRTSTVPRLIPGSSPIGAKIGSGHPTFCPSWPGLARPSTTLLAAPKTWMAATRAAMTTKRGPDPAILAPMGSSPGMTEACKKVMTSRHFSFCDRPTGVSGGSVCPRSNGSLPIGYDGRCLSRRIRNGIDHQTMPLPLNVTTNHLSANTE